MSRVYGERVEITARDNRPLRFVWRGRLYGVLAVLEHWVVSSQWWQRNNPDTGVPPEREFWRVEASPGGNIPPAVYELRRDAGTEDWQLVRIWDLEPVWRPHVRRERRPGGRLARRGQGASRRYSVTGRQRSRPSPGRRAAGPGSQTGS